MTLNDVLLENFDVITFLDSYGYNMKRVGGRTGYIGTCPWCGKNDHFGVNPATGFFGCYRCHMVGRFTKLIGFILQKDYFEVLDWLKNQVDERNISIYAIDEMWDEINKVKDSQTKVHPISTPIGYVPLQEEIEYTKKRKITLEQIKYYKMGVCKEGMYRDRLIVCDVDDRQNTIYWIARDITGKSERKVMNPSSDYVTDFGSGDILWNFSLTKQYDTCIITEGVFDALWIGNNACATYGYGLKHKHLFWLLLGNFQNVVIMYDPDVSDEELEKAGCLTSMFMDTYIVKLTKGDPDEHSKEELKELIDNAKLFSGSKLEKLRVEI